MGTKDAEESIMMLHLHKFTFYSKTYYYIWNVH